MQPRLTRCGETRPNLLRTFRQRAMYEKLMEASRGGRELPAGTGGGETQPGRGRDRSDDHGGTGTASSGELVDPQRQTPERDLRSESRAAGRDTQAKRGHTNVGHPDGTGSVHSAVVIASADAGFRSDIQRAQLWVSAGSPLCDLGESIRPIIKLRIPICPDPRSPPIVRDIPYCVFSRIQRKKCVFYRRPNSPGKFDNQVFCRVVMQVVISGAKTVLAAMRPCRGRHCLSRSGDRSKEKRQTELQHRYSYTSPSLN